jgi:hypothetical protein
VRELSKREAARLGQRFISALGIAAIPIGVLAPLAPDWWEGKWWPVILVATLACAWGLLGLIRGKPQHEYISGVTIRLVVGDLFEQDASSVVGFTTTFDTSVPSIIASTSVQAALLKKVYGDSQARLDADLTIALARSTPTGRTISKAGNTVCYPLGSVATLDLADGRHIYCAAYTEMNEHNNASGTIRSVLEGLDNSWEEADRVGNGAPICVPLIGQGQSRIPELTPEIAVRLIAFSFLLRSQKGRFANELRIVLHPSDKHKVNFSEFQAFLRSLAL